MNASDLPPPEYGDIERAEWEADIGPGEHTDPQPLIGSHTL